MNVVELDNAADVQVLYYSDKNLNILPFGKVTLIADRPNVL